MGDGEYFPLRKDLIRAPISALEFRVLVDILQRKGSGESIPSIAERSKLFGVTHKTMATAEQQLEVKGYLMIYPEPGREKLYLATDSPAPPGHPKRPEFVQKMHHYVNEKTLVEITRVGGGDGNPSNFYQTTPVEITRPPVEITRVGEVEAGSFPPDPPISPSSVTEILANSHDTQPPVGARAHENADPLAPPIPERPLTDPEECELAALRLYREEFEAELWRYHGTDPSDRAQQGYRNALEGFLRRGIRPTRAHLAEAVTRACASWKTLNRAYAPRDHGPVVSVLAALVNPMPTPEKTDEPRNGARSGPGSYRPADRRGRTPEQDAELAAKVERWRAGGRVDAPGGPERSEDGYRDLD